MPRKPAGVCAMHVELPKEQSAVKWNATLDFFSLLLERLPTTSWQPDWPPPESRPELSRFEYYLACWRVAYAESQHAIELALEHLFEAGGQWGPLLDKELYLARWMLENTATFAFAHVTDIFAGCKSIFPFPETGCEPKELSVAKWLVTVWWPHYGLKDAATQEARVCEARLRN